MIPRNGMIALMLLMLAASPARAAEMSPSARTEIDALLSRLGASDCRFYRNGTWYAAPKARDHMQAKLDYLVKKGDITSAEDFIAKAGTKSMLSGKPYKVSCPNHDEETSAAWFTSELTQVREHPGR